MTKILIVDSGIGGLSILRELLNEPQPHNYLYFADQAHFPYGDKSPNFVTSRLSTIVSYALSQQISAVVVACNTGTVHGIRELRSSFSLPIFGVEPIVKPLSRHKHAAILATTGTVQSPYTKNLVNKLQADHLKTISVPNLAQAIEDMSLPQVDQIIKSLKGELATTTSLGLSCTHYPLIKNQIIKNYPHLTIYDPSKAVARHVISSLQTNLSAEKTVSYLTTGNMLKLKKQLKFYLQKNITAHKVLI